MKKILVGAAIIASLSLGACSSTPSKSSTPVTYEEIIAEAKAQAAIAKKSGNVWKQKKMKKPYVETYIAKAEAAKKKGDDKAAMKWAQEALKLANAAVEQSKDSEGIKPAWIKESKK